MTRVSDIIKLLNNQFPENLACEWDNSGLQVGNEELRVTKILVTLDLTLDVVEEAKNNNCDMIISHHPLIFKAINNIKFNTQIGKIISDLIKNDIVLYSAHTNLDIGVNGLNDYLAEILGIKNVKPLKITKTEPCYKLIIYIPENHLKTVKNAILNIGSGHIGNYSHSSFAVKGKGTFKPLSGSNPFNGIKGEVNQTDEYRFETIISESQIEDIETVLSEKHPYEEVAYDIYQLKNNKNKFGLGRIGNLENSNTLLDFIDIVKNTLDLKTIKYLGDINKKIKKVSICSGSGADLIVDADKANADLFLTGDIKYHDAQLAEKIGIALLDAGHYETEIIVKRLLKNILEDNFKVSNIEVVASQVETNPWQKI